MSHRATTRIGLISELSRYWHANRRRILIKLGPGLYSELVATVELARQMGKVHRALDWQTAANVAGQPPGGRMKRAQAWLSLLLEEPGPERV